MHMRRWQQLAGSLIRGYLPRSPNSCYTAYWIPHDYKSTEERKKYEKKSMEATKEGREYRPSTCGVGRRPQGKKPKTHKKWLCTKGQWDEAVAWGACTAREKTKKRNKKRSHWFQAVKKKSEKEKWSCEREQDKKSEEQTRADQTTQTVESRRGEPKNEARDGDHIASNNDPR